MFSRQQFICVCVFVPPSSALQISQLCEELKGVESTLSVPISSLSPPQHTHTHRNLSLLCSLTLFSSLGLPLSHPPSSHLSLPLSRDLALNAPSSLNCEHHNSSNCVPLLCHTNALCPLVLLRGKNRPCFCFFFFPAGIGDGRVRFILLPWAVDDGYACRGGQRE